MIIDKIHKYPKIFFQGDACVDNGRYGLSGKPVKPYNKQLWDLNLKKNRN